MVPARRFGLALLGWLALSPLMAFDPSLVDQLVSDDLAVRQKALASAAALSDPDKTNLAPTLAQMLEDPKRGEPAGMALCRLGDPGVPFLDQHARLPYPGAEFAAMGLLMGPEKGHDALAAILRDADADAVLLALAVIKEAGVMPSVVSAEVANLSVDRDPRFSAAAREAQDAVKAAGEKKPESAPLDEAAFLKAVEAALQAAGETPQAAEIPEPQTENGADKFTPQTPDASEFRTRRPASESFSKNRPQ